MGSLFVGTLSKCCASSDGSCLGELRLASCNIKEASAVQLLKCLRLISPNKLRSLDLSDNAICDLGGNARRVSRCSRAARAPRARRTAFLRAILSLWMQREHPVVLCCGGCIYFTATCVDSGRRCAAQESKVVCTVCVHCWCSVRVACAPR